MADEQKNVVPKEMKAVTQEEKGSPDTMSVTMVPLPTLKDQEILIRVCYSAANRADTLQRKGLYPAPPGASPIMGLECAGVVAVVGAGCTRGFKVGDRVMALLSGGGYAGYVAADEGCVMPIGDSMDMHTAAAIPETWLTAFQLLHLCSGVQKDDYVLIHAGASGVGTAAIQLCLLAGAKPIVTAGSKEKLDFCTTLGAVGAVNYKTASWGKQVLDVTGGKGVNVILDCVGASHVADGFEAIAMEGRWVLYGLMGGASVENYPLGQILRKRVSLIGTTLRARSVAYKSDLVKRFSEIALPSLVKGTYKPIVDKVFPLEEVSVAHTRMEANLNTGKLLLEIAKE